VAVVVGGVVVVVDVLGVDSEVEVVVAGVSVVLDAELVGDGDVDGTTVVSPLPAVQEAAIRVSASRPVRIRMSTPSAPRCGG